MKDTIFILKYYSLPYEIDSTYKEEDHVFCPVTITIYFITDINSKYTLLDRLAARFKSVPTYYYEPKYHR